MQHIAPWQRLLTLIEPHYPSWRNRARAVLVSWGGVLGDFLMNACGSTMCQTFENVDLTPIPLIF